MSKNKNQAIKATGRSAPKLERNGENSVTILPAANVQIQKLYGLKTREGG